MCELDKDFLWGGASAANQMEGGYDLDAVSYTHLTLPTIYSV